MAEQDKKEQVLKGISASPGICIGQAYLVDKEGVDVVHRYDLPKEKIDGEIKRFKAAVKKACDELKEIIENTPDDLRDHVNILETQEVLLKDKMLYGRTLEIIENDHVNAEWALKVSVGRVKSMIQNMTELSGGADGLLPLWWALALGSCLGGNGSLVGASAKLIVAGFAERAGHPLHFLRFMMIAFPLMLGSIAISTLYVYLRYL